MKAAYTVKIDGKWYKAGDTIPDIEKKAVSSTEIPPVPFEDKKDSTPKQKRQYTRRR